MNRRTFLGAAAAAAMPVPALAADPLLETIHEYQAGLAEFNRLADAEPDDKRWDEFEIMTFGPPLARLQQWNQPAKSLPGAVAALRISLEEQNGVAGNEAAERMVKAALGYLESRAA